MKSILKFFTAVMLLAASFGVISCSDNEDDSPSVTATYYGAGVGTIDGVNMTITMKTKFYDNKEFVIDLTMTAVGETVASYSGTFFLGTYTGNPTKDGTVKMTIAKEYDFEQKKLVDIPSSEREEESFVISAGKAEIGEIFDDGSVITLQKQ